MESLDNNESKVAFRKPSNDASSRNYRRRSPINGSNSSDESPKCGGHKEGVERRSDDNHRRREDDRELDRDSGRNGRSGDHNRHSDRQSSRSSHGYKRNDDYRHGKYADEEEKNHRRSPIRSSRDSRDTTRSSHTRHEGEYNKSHDRAQDKYSRDNYDRSGHKSKDWDRETSSIADQKYKDRDLSSDRVGSGRKHTSSNLEEIKSGERDRQTRKEDRDEKKDHYGSGRDSQGGRAPSYEKLRGYRTESTSRKDISGNRVDESYDSEHNDLDYQKHSREEKKNHDNLDDDWKGDIRMRDSWELHQEKAAIVSEDQNSPAKKPKFSSSGKGTEYGKEGYRWKSSSLKQAQETVPKVAPQQGIANISDMPSDLNAAKFAAIKAAELVNRNLVGVGTTGAMSTDQKKKLLWGSKKSTAAEEQTGNRWDSSLFSDREQQEKFNRLMGVKGEVKPEHKPGHQDGSSLLQAEKQKELQLDLEKQYTAGLRRRDGRTVGLGL